MSTMVIPLTQGFSAVVDECDFDALNAYRWKILKAGKKFYAARSKRVSGKRYITFLMHRVIADALEGELVDHWNGDGLDNRRENLRQCNQSQNQANQIVQGGSSKYKGVHWNQDRQLWHAQIGAGVTEDGKQVVKYLGRYESEEDAALAYDRKARELFGEFALLNFPDGDDGRELVRSSKSKYTPKGEASHFAKLTREQAAEVKRRALAGELQKIIAADFNVSVGLVGLIKRGLAWKELEEIPSCAS